MNSTKDLLLYESGSGGELFLENNDLALTESLYQTIYVSLFGGNVEASTVGNELVGEERSDYWANSLLFKNEKNKQLNSRTERTLNEVTINSSGRLKIKSAVEEDLIFLKKLANLEINIVILGVDKIEIEIIMTSIQNQSNKTFQFIWDNAKREIILDKQI